MISAECPMNHATRPRHGKIILSCVVFLAVVASTSVCAAQVIDVPADYPAMQAALSAAQTGDTVKVQPGVYDENIVWPDTPAVH